MSYHRPAIIVTPSSPMASPNLSLLEPSEKPYPIRSGPLTYPTPATRYLTPVGIAEEQEASTVRRIQRKIQLLAAFLALLLSAMAFASIIHPSYHVASSPTNGIEQHHGLFDAMRVGFADHDFRPGQSAQEKRSLPNVPRSQENTIRPAKNQNRWFKRGTWAMPRMPTGSVDSTESDSAQPTQLEVILPADAAVHKINLADIKIRSTRAVQAQLMQEARARMTQRRKERLADRLTGKL